MLKKETLAVIAKLTKKTVEELEAAIKDENEVDLTVDEKLQVFSDDELATLKNNEYKNGKKAGEEMAVDDIKKAEGLDFTGKTVKGLADAIKKKTLDDAKIEPDKKVQELSEKLKTAQETANEYKQKYEEKESEITTVKTQGLIVKDIPANTTLPAEKVLLLMKADGYEHKVEDGKIIWHKDGKPLTDKLGNNLDTKSVTNEYVTANKLIAEGAGGGGTGGRGGGDKGGGAGKFSKLSELKAQFQNEGKNLLGDEFRTAVEAAKKADPEFDMQG